MTTQNLQEGLIDWFRLTPFEAKSIQQAEKVCEGLYSQYFPSKNVGSAKYQILYPLFRLGIVEFYPSGRCCLSPTCILEGSGTLVWINPAQIGEAIWTNKIIASYPFGMVVSKKDRHSIGELKNLDLKLSLFNFKGALQAIPRFDKIIASWPEQLIVDETRFSTFIGVSNWKRLPFTPEKGLFRSATETYGPRLVKLDSSYWRVVPSEKQNVDAINIASTWALLQNSSDLGVSYSQNRNTITIANIRFSLILERLLVLNTIIHTPENYSPEHRHYYISKADFQILNELFDHKINII